MDQHLKLYGKDVILATSLKVCVMYFVVIIDTDNAESLGTSMFCLVVYLTKITNIYNIKI